MKNIKQMDNEFKDDRPLTDEVFMELGFWKDQQIEEHWFKAVDNIYTDDLDDEFNLLIFGDSENQEVYLWEIGNRKCSPKWKTAGSVKMLIESLKGDK